MSSVANNEFSANQAVNTPRSWRQSRQQPGSACEECRRRKLRCDRVTPQCTACANSGAKCVVRSFCPPRGPRKGHVKELQMQLAELRARLNEPREKLANDAESTSRQIPNVEEDQDENRDEDNDEVQDPTTISWTDMQPTFGDMQSWPMPMANPLEVLPLPALNQQQTPVGLGAGVHITPLTCIDLDQLYFDRVHTFAPILQKFRYLSWSRKQNKTKQQVCLQHAMWALAASVSSQFQIIRHDFYKEARQRLDALETDNQGNPTHPRDICIEEAQAWILLAMYEITTDVCIYQRALVSAGRAFRLVQLMRLYNIDGHSPATQRYPGDCIEIESMRRTFWVAYTIDRFTSMMDDLPVTFNDRQIQTRLPAPDDHFMSGRASTMSFLPDTMNDVGEQLEHVSPFIESIIVGSICGKILEHKSHPRSEDQYEFCRRHQALNALLTRRAKFLSMHISSTSEHPDPMLIFVALMAHMAGLMLCEIIESRSLVNEAQMTQVIDTLLIEHKQQSLDAVQELEILTARLGQLNHFQTHPFTPMPLLLSARFCLAHIEWNDAYIALITSITTTLQELTNVNSLAGACLRLLGLDNYISTSL